MKRFTQTLAILVCGFVLTSCDYIFPSSWNYRITVEIETPEGVKSGSAVREVQAVLQPKITPETHPISYGTLGEAVVVDLGERGVVFALISSESYNEVYKAFPSSVRTNKERIQYYSSLTKGKKTELKTSLPWLATFTDRTNPLSLTGVDRLNMDKTFGEGVKFKRITIEMTDDPVTWGVVDKYLPKSFKSVLVDGWMNLEKEQKNRLYLLMGFKKGEK
ncbi:MAG: hypothetical protein OEY94_09250 [Alphaproteobacteria bacterium]|nr:hypothetical protein [Alphaproteobacteria bacterium]